MHTQTYVGIYAHTHTYNFTWPAFTSVRPCTDACHQLAHAYVHFIGVAQTYLGSCADACHQLIHTYIHTYHRSHAHLRGTNPRHTSACHQLRHKHTNTHIHIYITGVTHIYMGPTPPACHQLSHKHIHTHTYHRSHAHLRGAIHRSVPSFTQNEATITAEALFSDHKITRESAISDRKSTAGALISPDNKLSTNTETNNQADSEVEELKAHVKELQENIAILTSEIEQVCTSFTIHTRIYW
jgi:hypothetical protein